MGRMETDPLLAPSVQQAHDDYDDDYGDDESFEDDEWNKAGTGTFLGSMSNLANSALGAGILAFPYAFQCAGVLLGPLIAVVFALITVYSLHIIGDAQQKARGITYQDIIKRMMGPMGEKAMIGAQLLFLVGACVAYLIIVYDQLGPEIEPLLSPGEQWVRPVVITAAALGICLPLCFVKNIQKLAPMANFSMLSIFFMCTVLLVFVGMRLNQAGFPHITSFGATSSLVNPGIVIFQAVPLISFAYAAQPSYTVIFRELKGRSLGRMDRIALCAMAMCCVLYIIVGQAGYFYALSINYRDPNTGVATTPDDILKAWSPCTKVQLAHNMTDLYPNGAPAPIIVSRVCIAISVLSSYVSLHFAARLCLQDLLTGPKGFNKCQWYTATIIFVSATCGAAIVIPNISTVLSFTGATTVVAMMFLFPARLLHLRWSPRSEFSEPFLPLEPLRNDQARTGKCARRWNATIAPVLLVVLGVTLGTLAIWVTSRDL